MPRVVLLCTDSEFKVTLRLELLAQVFWRDFTEFGQCKCMLWLAMYDRQVSFSEITEKVYFMLLSSFG